MLILTSIHGKTYSKKIIMKYLLRFYLKELFVLGLIFGILVNLIDLSQSDKKLIIEVLSIGGEIFLKIIKMFL